jgi:hypothetical protein
MRQHDGSAAIHAVHQDRRVVAGGRGDAAPQDLDTVRVEDRDLDLGAAEVDADSFHAWRDYSPIFQVQSAL